MTVRGHVGVRPAPVRVDGAVAPRRATTFRHQKWKRVQFQFGALTQLQKFKGPRFVFAHILCPHDPLVFGRDGHFVSREEEATLPRAVDYVNQLVYVNKQVEKVVRALLARPLDRAPGDHHPVGRGALPRLAARLDAPRGQWT